MELLIWDYMDYLSYNFDDTFFTTGNHEYWNDKGYSIDNINNIINDKIISYNNIYYLNNNKIILDDYEILGSTLWSNPNKNNIKSMDFLNIYAEENKRLTPKKMRKLFNKNKSWLERNIKKKKKKKIILTHYLPSYKFTKKYKKYKYVHSLFASDLEYLMNDPVKLWIFGHTHDNFVSYINNIPCCVNALGMKLNVNLNEIKL